MSSKQTTWTCQACGKKQTFGPEYPMDLATCRKCGGPVHADSAKPSPVSGVGQGKVLDLGLALLLEAQTPGGGFFKYRKEKDFRDRPGK